MNLIKKIWLEKLSNLEHLQFLTEFKALADDARFGEMRIKLESKYAHFCSLYEQELLNMSIIRNTLYIGENAQIDKQRDSLDAEIRKAIQKAKHFKKFEQANAIDILLCDYRNMSRKSLKAQIVATNILLQKFRGKYSDAVQVVKIGACVDEIERLNDIMSEIEYDHYNKQVKKAEQNISEMRTEINAIYREIIKHLEALIIVDGAHNYKDFLMEINELTNKHTIH